MEMTLRISVFLVLACLASAPAFCDDMDSSAVARGKYVEELSDCSACHTASPKEPFAGGMPLTTPIGPIYPTNITPDPQFGIGQYTLKDFRRALKDGVAKDGHYLYPAMPYPSYARLTDQDVSDLYAYLMKSVAPVHKPSGETKLPFPFNLRWGLAIWNALFMPGDEFRPSNKHDPEWNRGAYLVQSAAHCGSCHTPRDPAYQQKAYDETSADFLSGGYLEHWYAPDLRGDMAEGLGRWSEDDIVSFLKTGHAKDDAAFGNMRQMVENSGQYFSDTDLHAIAHYLKSLSARAEASYYGPPPDPSSEMKTILSGTGRPGAGLYLSSCASCHGMTGAGQGFKAPALAGNPTVLAENPGSIISILLQGDTTAATKTGPPPQTMPGFSRFTDAQIADVLNFIRNSWGNGAPMVSARTVADVRAKVKEDPKTPAAVSAARAQKRPAAPAR